MRGTTAATNRVAKYLKNSERRGRVVAPWAEKEGCASNFGMSGSGDHLVGAEQDGRCIQLDAEEPGRLQIDHQLEFFGPHDRKNGRILAAQDPVGVTRKPPVSRALIGAI